MIVFIIGAPRSGTSYMFRLLKDTGYFDHVLNEPRSVWNVGYRYIFDDANRLSSIEAKSHIQKELYNKGRLLEKSPANSLRYNLLAQLFPDARYVILHRDKENILRSTQNMWSSYVRRVSTQRRKDTGQRVVHERITSSKLRSLRGLVNMMVEIGIRLCFRFWGPLTQELLRIHLLEGRKEAIEAQVNRCVEGTRMFERMKHNIVINFDDLKELDISALAHFIGVDERMLVKKYNETFRK